MLILRSDNFQEQYKCKYIFQKIKKTGIKWFYGETGHSNGLVYAMSSFACKQQLIHEIISNDTSFDNAEEIAGFLKQYFKDDSTK